MAVIEFGMASLLKRACKDVGIGLDNLSSNLDQSMRFSDKEVPGSSATEPDLLQGGQLVETYPRVFL